jgi:hypothetical protein
VRKAWRILAALALFGVMLVPMSASAQGDEYVVWPYVTDLNWPNGLAIDQDGYVLVAEAGATETSGTIWRLIDRDGDRMIGGRGEMKAVVNTIPALTMADPEDPEGGTFVSGVADVDVAEDGELYFVQGGGIDPYSDLFASVWSTAVEGPSYSLWTAHPYANLGLYEFLNDPACCDVNPNPYGIVAGDDGDVYVADAGANVVYHVAADGTISVFAVMPRIPVDPAFELFPDTDFVPTGIAWGPDGALYVGGLTGFPFAEGTAMVLRLEDTDDDGSIGDDEWEVYADGLTTVTGIAFDNNGDLIVSEFRSGLPLDNPESMGRVVRMTDAGGWEVLADGLISPTYLAVGWDNTIYVTMLFAGMVMAIAEAPPAP